MRSKLSLSTPAVCIVHSVKALSGVRSLWGICARVKFCWQRVWDIYLFSLLQILGGPFSLFFWSSHLDLVVSFQFRKLHHSPEEQWRDVTRIPRTDRCLRYCFMISAHFIKPQFNPEKWKCGSQCTFHDGPWHPAGPGCACTVWIQYMCENQCFTFESTSAHFTVMFQRNIF